MKKANTIKKTVQVEVEVPTVEEGEGGLERLLGKSVVVWCMNYIYSGKLAGVNDSEVMLEDAHVVYETGGLGDSKFKDAQPLPSTHYIRLSAVESYGARGW